MNKKNLSLEKIKKLILEQLDESGINLEQIEVLVKKGPVIVLRGEVYSEEIRKIINQIVNDTIDVDGIIDEMDTINVDFNEDDDQENDDEEDSDDDDESFGTKDVFKSIEDGIPYIPPTTSPIHDDLEEGRRNKRKKKKR